MERPHGLVGGVMSGAQLSGSNPPGFVGFNPSEPQQFVAPAVNSTTPVRMSLVPPPMPVPLVAHFAPQSAPIDARPSAEEERVGKCLESVCRNLNCGHHVGVAVLSLLATSLQLRDAPFSVGRSVPVTTATVGLLETAVRERGESHRDAKALAWLVERWREGTRFPQVFGGNAITRTNKRSGHESIVGEMPQTSGDDLTIDLLIALQRNKSLEEGNLPEASGKPREKLAASDSSTKTFPRICSASAGFPLELYQLLGRGTVSQYTEEVNESFKKPPRRNKSAACGFHATEVVTFVRLGRGLRDAKPRYRHITYANRGTSPIFLVKCGLRTPRSEPEFAVMDDCGITDSRNEMQQREPEVLRLEPKQSYHVTVVWNDPGAETDPEKKCPSILSSASTADASAIHMLFWNEDGGFNTAQTKIRIAEAGYRVAGERASMSQREEPIGREVVLNTEAELYISKSLSNIFTCPPTMVHGVDSMSLISGLIGLGILQHPSPHIIATPFKSMYDTKNNFIINRISEMLLLRSKHSKDYTMLRRSLISQEIKDVNACDAYSMYHVSLGRGRVHFKKRRYREVGKNGGRDGPYAGPILQFSENGEVTNTSTMDVILLEVPGMPEKEPLLSCGSLVYLRPADEKTIECIAIMIASHTSTAILLAPDCVFDMLGSKWHIQFGVDHGHHSRLHMGLHLVRKQNFVESFQWNDSRYREDLTKEESEEQMRQSIRDLNEFLNKKILGRMYIHDALSASLPMDSSQQRVVQKVWAALSGGKGSHGEEATPLAEDLRPRKYNLICCKGPAGTGKSLTAMITAAFVALVSRITLGLSARILICTPEEYTADLLTTSFMDEIHKIAEKYPEIVKNKPKVGLLRVNDPKRPVSYASKDSLLFSKISPYGTFEVPTRKEILEAQVIVTSNKSCWLLHRGSERVAAEIGFDLCIIDEAGQASILDALMALSCLGSAKGADQDSMKKTVLMLGDEHQLGPGGKGTSVRGALEAWGNDTYCSSVIRLTRNYRSNAGLLEVPKQMFYGDALSAEAPLEEVKSPDISKIELFDDLNQGAPETSCQDSGKVKSPASILILGVDGTHKRSSIWAKGRSCFNQKEAETIKDICAEFNWKVVANPNQISVISLSRAQVMLIRQELRAVGLGDIRCGTIDDFQGQQADVVVISCVGTTVEALDLNEKRFNVAITRARRLLIVVGSLGVLMDAASGPWHQLASSCTEKGALLTLNEREDPPEAEENGDNHEGEDENGEPGLEREVTLTKLTALARTALLGGGHASALFPERLYDHNMEYGWAHTDDEMNTPARIQL